MAKLITTALALTSALTMVAACSEETSLNFFQPAGAFLDEGQFGNATMRNTMAQKCAGQPKGYIVPDPIVVLDADSPKSPQAGSIQPAYRQGHIRCSGNLNGKYAEIVFNEYVDSATEVPISEQGANIQLPGG